MRPIAEGVWQIDGSPAASANVFYAGAILFDCRTRWAAGGIAKQLGRSPVSFIALTHAHPDHWGAASALSARFDARVAVHRADAGIVTGREDAGTHVAFRIGKRFWEGEPCREVVHLEDGDRIGDFRVVHTPGHSAGHVVYFRESDRLAVTGDLFSTMDTLTHRRRIAEPPAYLSVDAGENRRSIRRLLELDPSMVLPGHGPALRDMGRLADFAAELAGGSGYARTAARLTALSGPRVKR